ncbi:MAG TPA: hypothetical protein VLH80_07300 [Nitrospiraceae bacterium]|nr:hypothetical protein [Nitrospiraceae bacterium]
MPGRSGRDEMQGAPRSYGAPLGAQEPVNATDRPKVGPAPENVQRAALAQQGLYRKPVGSAATPAPPKSAAPPPNDSPTRDLSIGTAAQRIQANPSNIERAINEQSQ